MDADSGEPREGWLVFHVDDVDILKLGVGRRLVRLLQVHVKNGREPGSYCIDEFWEFGMLMDGFQVLVGISLESARIT